MIDKIKKYAESLECKVEEKHILTERFIEDRCPVDVLVISKTSEEYGEMKVMIVLSEDKQSIESLGGLRPEAVKNDYSSENADVRGLSEDVKLQLSYSLIKRLAEKPITTHGWFFMNDVLDKEEKEKVLRYHKHITNWLIDIAKDRKVMKN